MSTNVAVGAAPTFKVSALETISAGYIEKICYECEIAPTGLAPIFFTKAITISQAKGSDLDCFDLSPNADLEGQDVKEITLPYLSNGNGKLFEIDDFFKFQRKDECILNCSLGDRCFGRLTGSEIVVKGSSPLKFIAKNDVQEGYSKHVCIKCSYENTEQRYMMFINIT